MAAPAQAGIVVQMADVQVLRHLCRGVPVGERDVPVHEHAGDGPVEQAGIEMSEAVMLGEALAQGALARGGGTVDGDDHGRLNPGSSRRAPA